MKGLGAANLYPATLLLALGAVPVAPAQASARATLASGLAILCARLLLGAVSDALSLFKPQSVVALLMMLPLPQLY